MEITVTTLILVGVVCVVLGFIASMLLNSLREEVEEPSAPPVETPPGGRKGRYTPIARLWRDKDTNRLVVELDGKSLVTAEPLDQQQRSRLQQAARDLRAWLGMGMAESYPAAPMAETLRGEWTLAEPEAAASATPPASAAFATVAPVASPTPAVPLVTATAAAARFGSPRNTGKLPPLEEAAVPAVAKQSIVMQINDILQDMLEDSPLRHRGIRLFEDLSRGVLVTLDGKQYEGIDGVPDLEVKAFIRSAVATWEQSQ